MNIIKESSKIWDHITFKRQRDFMRYSISMKHAEKFTIALIKQEGDVESVIGHGILLKSNQRQNQYVIGTAANIAVGAADSYNKGTLKKIRFSSGTVILIANVDMCFIPDDYYDNGTRDVGGLLVSLDTTPLGWNNPAIPSTLALKVPQNHPDKKTIFTGSASGWEIYSSVTQNMESDMDGRVELANPSKPGLSGAPLFSPTGDFLAVLHGDSKHRLRGAQRGRHTGNLNCDISSNVHVDLVKNLDDQKVWDTQYYNFLENVEWVEETDLPMEFPKPNSKSGFFRDKTVEQVNSDSTPGKPVQEVYDSALNILGQEHPVFNNGSNFTIPSLCEAIKAHSENFRQEHDDGKFLLSDYLETFDSKVVAVADPATH